MATFVLTIGAATEAETVNSVGSGPNFAIVMAAGPASFTIVVGDMLTDSAANDYLITAVTDQTHFTVIDYKSVATDPVTGLGTVLRSDVNLSNAEADIGNYAASGDSVTWSCMNDGTLDDLLLIGDSTLGSGSLTITSPPGERHTGTAGTGLVIDPTTDGTIIKTVNTWNYSVLVEFLEITGFTGTGASARGVELNNTGTGNHALDSLIIHDSVASGADGILISVDQSTTITNCIIYDLLGWGLTLSQDVAGDSVLSCTIRNCNIGILEFHTSGKEVLVQNCAVFDNGTNFSGSDWHANSGNNASNTTESGIPGGTGSGNLGSLTSSNEFVDLTGGSEDFRLKSTSSLVNAGVDLSGTFTLDIISTTRTTPWDIGAFDKLTGDAGGEEIPRTYGIDAAYVAVAAVAAFPPGTVEALFFTSALTDFASLASTTGIDASFYSIPFTGVSPYGGIGA